MDNASKPLNTAPIKTDQLFQYVRYFIHFNTSSRKVNYAYNSHFGRIHIVYQTLLWSLVQNKTDSHILIVYILTRNWWAIITYFYCENIPRCRWVWCCHLWIIASTTSETMGACVQGYESTHSSRVKFHYLPSHSMVQNPSWEANWFAASQEFPSISRNPKVHYRNHKRTPLVYPGPAQSSPYTHIPPPGDPS